VRNSWGVTWGQAGYIYLEYGKNLCNLASDATSVDGCKVL
jgi:C1A family cysteine protease